MWGEMSSAVVSLVIAIVGVLGTLASAVATQRMSHRAKLAEMQHEERLRLTE
jgi:hypothetical protein